MAVRRGYFNLLYERKVNTMKKSDSILTIMSVVGVIMGIILLAKMLIDFGWSILYDIDPYMNISLWSMIIDVCLLAMLGLLTMGTILYGIVANTESKGDSED